MSSKRSGMEKEKEKEKETVTPDSSGSASKSDEIQQPQTVEPNKTMDDRMSLVEGQLTLLKDQYLYKTMDDRMSSIEGQLTLLKDQYVELKGVMTLMKQMLNKLEGIEKIPLLLDKIALNAYAFENIGHGEENIDQFLDQLPLESFKEMEAFNTEISESPEKFNSLVQSLYMVSCEDNNHIISPMMKYLMSDKAASTLLGPSKNRSFQRLKLYNAIIDARKRSMPTFRKNEMKTVLSDYLKNVTARIKNQEKKMDDIK